TFPTGAPPAAWRIVAVEPDGAQPVAMNTSALRQSPMIIGTGWVPRLVTDVSLSTEMAAVPDVSTTLVLNMGVPGRAVRRTNTSLPFAGAGLAGIARSRAGVHAVAPPSKPYTGLLKSHSRVLAVRPAVVKLGPVASVCARAHPLYPEARASCRRSSKAVRPASWMRAIRSFSAEVSLVLYRIDRAPAVRI